MTPQILSNSHSASLERFLAQRAESSMVLRSNSGLAGLDDQGCLFEGTYAAFMKGEEITGVAALYWNGMAFLQAPAHGDILIRAAMTASGRNLTGLAGPWDQVQQALNNLDIKHGSCVKTGKEVLFSLNLDSLKIPDQLRMHNAVCRHPFDDELQTLFEWHIAYSSECLNRTRTDSLECETWQILDHLQNNNRHWILEKDNKIVATSSFNAILPDMVQVGAVYTPPVSRSKGYARSVVAGSLMDAVQKGVRQAVLFTGTDMAAAKRAYAAIGFTQIGEYGLVILGEKSADID